MALSEDELRLQADILASKTDTNDNMTYKTSAILNKGLNPEFFSGNYTKIVNALNQLATDATKVNTMATEVSDKVNEILLDIDLDSNLAIWEQLKVVMEQPTIIQGLTDLYAGKQVDKVLGISEDAIGKVLSVDKNDNGDLILKAIDQIAGGITEVKVEEIAYENRYVSSITNVKGALDYVVNAVANNEFEGGLGGGTIIGEITWDMIDDRPTEIADNLLLTGTHLELKDGNTVISSVPLAQDNDIEGIIEDLNVEEQN